ncbi:MAG: hypothetical protein H7124_18455 [Phycisphaerales bacterium]|nr:hypothetical protein [Hyphomonadaceae bacterium]
MRRAVFVALIALSACATTPGALPTPRYADAASRGALASVFAGRPSATQVAQANEAWSLALGDSFACGAPVRDVLNAGLVGALEIAAMNAAASGGGEAEIRNGVGEYVGEVARMAVERRARPSVARCDALAGWAPRTAEQGRETVARARANGLMDDDYGLLLDLLSR